MINLFFTFYSNKLFNSFYLKKRIRFSFLEKVDDDIESFADKNMIMICK
jgi:hypothetical protein